MMEELVGKKVLDVLNGNSGKLAVVKFSSGWCGPCRALSSALREAALWDRYPDVEFYEVNTHHPENAPVCIELGITSIPRMFLVEDGDVLEEWRGYSPDVVSELEVLLEKGGGTSD